MSQCPVDTTRSYTTRSGKRVVIHDYVRFNSAGDEVTFPVKGNIVEAERPRSRTRMQIWTNEGRANALPGASPDDLIDFPAVRHPELASA